MPTKPQDLAYSYIRFSQTRQGSGHSTARQEAGAEAWASRNNASLDNSTYRDLGVSAFTGAHRQNPDRHGLALFLKAVEEGKVPKGSFLLVENLDRLTREHLRAALSLFLGILDAGIHVVSLSPERVFRADATGDDAAMDLLVAVTELSRGNRESARKSDLIGKNWAAAREGARAGNLPKLKSGCRGLPCRHPFWIDRTPDGYALNGKAEAIRLAYRLARAGRGANAARLEVNARFGLKLSRPYFRELLPRSTARPTRRARPRARLALGEWQPCDKSGRPIGGVVNLYPAVVTEAEYRETQAAVTSRDRGGGTQGRKRVYLFNALMRDEHGEGFTVGKATVGRGAHKFIPKRHLEGRGRCVSFPVRPFEAAMVAALREFDPGDVLPCGGEPGADELLSLTGRREALLRLVRDAADAMRPGQEIRDVVRRMAEWEKEADELDAQIADLRRWQEGPAREAWSEVRGPLDLDDEYARARMRSAMSRIVERMTCIFHGHGRYRLAMVQVDFQHSTQSRTVCISYRSATNTFRGLREEELAYDTRAQPPASTDLKAQAQGVRAFLTDFAQRRERKGSAPEGRAGGAA